MSSIDNLNFKVVLDDKDFNDRVKQDIEIAKDLNMALTDYLDIKTKLGKAGLEIKSAKDFQKIKLLAEKTALAEAKTAAATAKAAQESAKLAGINQKTATEAEKTALAEAKVRTEKERQRLISMQINKLIKEGNSAYNEQSNLLAGLKNAAGMYLSVYGVKQFLSALVNVTGEFEKQKIALRAILKDEQGADELFENLRELALISPFQFKDLAGYAKQLAAFGVPLHELYNTTKMLADVSAGVGVDMGRIILAYGQIRNASFLRASELRQLTEAGIPILDILSNKMSEVEKKTVSVADVFDRISKRQVSFEMVADAFREMTSEGGKFYQMQEVLSEGIEGKVSNLKDAFNNMLNTIGEDHSGAIKGTIDGLRVLMENYDKLGKVLVGIITTYGAYKAALIMVKAVNYAKALSDDIQLLKMGRKELGLLTAAQQVFGKTVAKNAAEQAVLNKALKANIYVAIASAIVGAVAALVSFNKKQKEAAITAGEVARGYQEEQKNLKKLFDAARADNASRTEKAEAIKKINEQYGQYLSGLVSETDSVDKLAKSYDTLTASIKNRYLEEQRGSIVGESQTKHNNAESELWNFLQSKILSKSGLSASAIGSLVAELQKRFAEIQKTWDAGAIYKEVLGMYGRSGGSALSERTKGSLFRYIFNFKETQADLSRAESLFNDFANGFEGALAQMANSGDAAAGEVLTKVKDIVDRIESGAKEIDQLVRKAETVGLTDAEKKKLEALRTANSSDIQEFKDITGRDFSKSESELRAYRESLEKYSKDVSRAIEKSQDEITSAEINAMEKGHAQTIAKIEEEHRIKERSLKWAYEDELSEIEKLERSHYKNTHNGNETDFLFDAENSDRAKELRKRISAELVAESIRYNQAIASAEKERDKTFREHEEEYLKTYGAYKEKEAAIISQYARLIKEAATNGDKALEKSLKAKRDSELYNLAKDNSSLFALIFADAGELSQSQLWKAIRLTQEEIRKAESAGDVQRLTELYARLREQLTVKSESDFIGFSGIAKAIKQIRKAESNYTNALASGNKDEADNALSERSAAIAALGKNVSTISDAFGSLGEMLESFGGVLGEIGSGIKGLFGNTDNILTAFFSNNKSEVLQSGISSLLGIFDMAFSQINENRKAQEEWNSKVKDCIHEYALLNIEALEYKEKNFFAVENPYSKAIAGAAKYAAALKELNVSINELQNGKVQTGQKYAVNAKNVGVGAAAGAGVGAAIGSLVPVIGTALGAAVGAAIGAIGGALTLKTVPVFESIVDKYGTILDNSSDELFALNPQILADYQKLDDETKKIVDNWEEIRKAAIQAEEEMTANFAELSGTLGDDLRNELVNAFRNNDLESAIDAFHGKVTGVIEDIVSKIVFSSIFEETFNNLAADMKKSFALGGDQDITDDIIAMSEKLPGLLDLWAQAMETARVQFSQKGFNLWERNGSTQDLGNSIRSSMTEEQGGLFASYLNAMRADLSYMRGQTDKYYNYMFAAIPTLADHVAKIAANTADMNMRTQEMLETLNINLNHVSSIDGTLKGIVSYSSGLPSVRTSDD